MVIEKFRKLWESNDAGGLAELYSEDALLDMNMPGWRFQLQGPEAISRQVAGYFERGPVKVLDWRARTSDWGAVVEESTNWEVEPEGLFYRQVHIFLTEGDHITEHIIYCAGEWDKATVERQKAEAPMIRP